MKKYYTENNEIHEVSICHDDYCDSPREDCNIGKMNIWWNRYSLGDKKEGDPMQVMDALFKDIPSEKILKYIRNSNTKNGLKVGYDATEKIYRLTTPSGVEEKESKRYLKEMLLDYLTLSEKMDILEACGYYFLMMGVYEHSGLSVYSFERDTKTNPHPCRFDSGTAGFIYVTKKAVLDEKISFLKGDKWILANNKNWKEAANFVLSSEVKIYNMYLQGEVYGIVDKNLSTGEEESCWGFYSSKYGEELFDEISMEFLGEKNWRENVA